MKEIPSIEFTYYVFLFKAFAYRKLFVKIEINCKIDLLLRNYATEEEGKRGLIL